MSVPRFPLLLLAGQALLWCNPNAERFIKEADRTYNVSARIINALAETETGRMPYTVGIRTGDGGAAVAAALDEIGVAWQRYGENSLRAEPKDIKEAAVLYGRLFATPEKTAQAQIIDADLGFMQINFENFSLLKLGRDAYLDLRQNIMTGTRILREECFERLRGYPQHYIIECYNKGPNVKRIERGGFDYYARFITNYKKGMQ